MTRKLLTLSVLIVLSGVIYAKSSSVLGTWVQVDEHTGKPHSLIKIYQEKQGICGKIIKVYRLPNLPFTKTCVKCEGALQNTPIIGLQIMQNFQQEKSNFWTNGTILDPDSGSIYKCQLTLMDDGKELKVHGYIGIPLLGRTQVWHRYTRT